MKYAIKLPKGKGYLCYAGTNRVVIYDQPTGFPIGMDIASCKGERVALEEDAFRDVYVSGWYDNNIEEIECPIKSLAEFQGFSIEREEQEVYLH
ncbi:MAG: hypothetical protein Unbinned4294contig1001_46 [Prokaryotic dsDNA virus sp.]|jgi:hypothetical protein|nr:MAG: hypothetical protein Unbinned4294contig1001_46 [Prokaryotic dsDNA virus sp.]